MPKPNEADRIIGRLEEFRDWTKMEFLEVKKELKSLQRFKWQLTGGAAVVSLAVSLLIELIKK